MLTGLYLLYSIYQKHSISTKILFIYLIVVLMYFSRSQYYIFHITSLLILGFLTHNYFYNYWVNKHKTTMWLAYSFAIIAVSQIPFIFVRFNPVLYVIGEIIQARGT